jgi:GT2 family glycosyltransferase
MCEETHFDQSETLNSGSLDTKSYADYAPTDKGGPLLSILLPVHNTQAKWLRACIASVLEQSYDNWELCIVDDASDRQETVAFLERVAHADGRIRLLRRNVNGHISKATNTALEAARGGFIVLLDHDDVLHLDALREVAGAITLNPHWDLIYTDEDRINESGRRFFPYFKPDYNPSLLEGQNCISHLGVYRTDIVRRLGGFRVGYEGSQDWDLALRVCDEVGKERVGHIPRVLYHWRVSDISTASDVMAKPYVRSAAKKAIGDHLQRLDQVAEVMEIPWNPGQFRIQYPLRGRASVSLLIPRSSGFEEPASLIALLSNSIDSKLDVEIIFSGSWSMHEVAGLGYSRVKGMQLRHEAGIAEQYNCLARGAAGDVLIFMAAPLVPVDKRCLPELVSQAQRNDIGIAGGKIYDPSGWVRQAYLECTAKGDICDVYRRAPSGSSGQMNRLMLVQDVPLVPLNGAAVRRHLFEEVDGLKPDLPFTISSADFCRRLKARGYRLLFTPFAEFFADNDPAEAGSIHGGEAS